MSLPSEWPRTLRQSMRRERLMPNSWRRWHSNLVKSSFFMYTLDCMHRVLSTVNRKPWRSIMQYASLHARDQRGSGTGEKLTMSFLSKTDDNMATMVLVLSVFAKKLD
eukprot:760385-Hanusia_phi.AAC.3